MLGGAIEGLGCLAILVASDRSGCARGIFPMAASAASFVSDGLLGSEECQVTIEKLVGDYASRIDLLGMVPQTLLTS